MTISANSVVALHYTLTDDDGVQLDSSIGKDPLTYLHGGGNIIPGLEQALEGKDAGDTFQVSIAPEQGYGEHVEQLIQSVPREAFAGVEQLDLGMRFQAQTPQGPISVEITQIEGDIVTVDGNHPLAGKTLHFDVSVETVRDATEQELEHGHAHGAHGHDH